jgi:hypothetical protein
MRGGLAPGGDLPRWQQDEEGQTGLVLGSTLAMQPCLEGIEVFAKER